MKQEQYQLIKQAQSGDKLALEKLTKDNCPQILFSDKGKPYFESHPLYFSISHSADLIVCVINEKEIGIDVEKISHFNPKLIDRICNDDEREYIGYSIENFFKILFKLLIFKFNAKNRPFFGIQ